MEICIVTNHRNSVIFADNLSKANQELGNNTYIFELDYDKTVQDERSRLTELLEQNNIDIALFLNDFQFSDKSYFIDNSVADKVDCRLWIWDAVHDVKELGNHIYLYSKIYSFEINDIVQLKQYYAIDACYLPLYAGQEFYNLPRSNSDVQDIDIFFIGTIAGSKKRLNILESAAKLAYEQGYL